MGGSLFDKRQGTVPPGLCAKKENTAQPMPKICLPPPLSLVSRIAPRRNTDQSWTTEINLNSLPPLGSKVVSSSRQVSMCFPGIRSSRTMLILLHHRYVTKVKWVRKLDHHELRLYCLHTRYTILTWPCFAPSSPTNHLFSSCRVPHHPPNTLHFQNLTLYSSNAQS